MTFDYRCLTGTNCVHPILHDQWQWNLQSSGLTTVAVSVDNLNRLYLAAVTPTNSVVIQRYDGDGTSSLTPVTISNSLAPQIAAVVNSNLVVTARTAVSSSAVTWTDSASLTVTLGPLPALAFTVALLNASGQWLWQAAVTSAPAAVSGYDPIAVAVDASGLITVAFDTSSAAAVTFYDADGLENFAVIGATGSGDQCLFAQLNASGYWQWVARVDGQGTNEVTPTVAVEPCGTIYVAGSSPPTSQPGFYQADGTLTFTLPASASNSVQIWLGALSAFGQWQWRARLDGVNSTLNAVRPHLALDVSGNLFLAFTRSSIAISGYSSDNLSIPVATLPSVATNAAIGLCKYNSTGILYGGAYALALNASSLTATSLALDGVGQCYLTGVSTGATGNAILDFFGAAGELDLTLPLGATGTIIYLAVLNAEGVWSRGYHVQDVGTMTTSPAVAVDCSFRAYLAGTQLPGHGSLHYYNPDNSLAMLSAVLTPAATGPNLFLGSIVNEALSAPLLAWVVGVTGSNVEVIFDGGAAVCQTLCAGQTYYYDHETGQLTTCSRSTAGVPYRLLGWACSTSQLLLQPSPTICWPVRSCCPDSSSAAICAAFAAPSKSNLCPFP